MFSSKAREALASRHGRVRSVIRRRYEPDRTASELKYADGVIADWFSFAGWGLDDIFSECHYAGAYALADRHGLSFCAEAELDDRILADPAAYARYVDRLDQVLADTSDETFAQAAFAAHAALLLYLRRPDVAAVMLGPADISDNPSAECGPDCSTCTCRCPSPVAGPSHGQDPVIADTLISEDFFTLSQEMIMMNFVQHFFVAMGLCALVACGDSNTGGGGDGGPSPECTRDSDCEPGKVCEPSSQTCVVEGMPCTDHAECTGGTYCEANLGACQPGSTGSPCAGPENCSSGECLGSFCGCTGVAHERQLEGGPLDVYLVLDRTGSMGTDCDYTPGTTPPESSKACYATYALSDYLSGVAPIVDTRLAFQFMSQPDDCDGSPYVTPLIPMTSLPVASDHTIIQAISDEDFGGGLGTHIEGALRGIAGYTAGNLTAGREMIGVLITDGDPQGCEEDISTLAQIIADHRTNTGIRTFIIGMEGATEDNLEQLAVAGGAKPHDDYCGSLTPPCHYWNVGNGSGDVLASALQAIVEQAAPLPCQLDVTGLSAPEGEMLDYGKVNVAMTQDGMVTTIGQVPDAVSCPAEVPAWYYDNPTAPTTIQLCENACGLVSGAGDGARLDVVVGCTLTIIIE